MITKKTIKFSILVLSILSLNLKSYSQKNEDVFTPHGKPLIVVFSNVNSTFNKEGNSREFEITRAYLGYEHSFSKTLSSRVILDVGDPGTGGLQLTAFLKNALLMYKNNKLSARFGMIGTDQFSLQEKQWGYRYISKSFQDEYKFGSSADLGAAIEYAPVKFISLDASVLNGEGYKKMQSDSVLKATFGITIKPIEGLVFRGYSDIMGTDHSQRTIALYAGYTYKAFRAGFEYNVQQNNNMRNGHDFEGISVYSSIQIAEKFSVFARYDNLWSGTISDEVNPWNYNRDGELFLAGIDYSPVQGIKIAPAFIRWSPSDNTQSLTSTIGLHFEIKY